MSVKCIDVQNIKDSAQTLWNSNESIEEFINASAIYKKHCNSDPVIKKDPPSPLTFYWRSVLLAYRANEIAYCIQYADKIDFKFSNSLWRNYIKKDIALTVAIDTWKSLCYNLYTVNGDYYMPKERLDFINAIKKRYCTDALRHLADNKEKAAKPVLVK